MSKATPFENLWTRGVRAGNREHGMPQPTVTLLLCAGDYARTRARREKTTMVVYFDGKKAYVLPLTAQTPYGAHVHETVIE